ncbi:TetR/AcrR family transcriptional regulator [Aureispira anguillae]|uniref:TetR/AcrR family transcriptional regulator n=1 Tax=Aureispira anguillae TaxID=2864201 RepID=A0A915YJM5_9BACT|nr:TetR/AcrR family transcriptional regulator [Aureispira anguillae]BDS14414.1 TetR/AcrR family transcriptional regulator [Aureispira anguillae]
MPKIKTSKLELIQKSLIVFKNNGYQATSISMLAKACDVEKAHLYYYFKNKEDLMFEVLNYLKEDATEHILSIAYDESINYSDRLEKLLEALKNFYKETQLGCLMTNTVLQTLYKQKNFSTVAQEFCSNLIEAIAHLYQDRYSPKYAIGKAEQAVQDMYGGLIFAQIYEDHAYLDRALKRIKKKV